MAECDRENRGILATLMEVFWDPVTLSIIVCNPDVFIHKIKPQAIEENLGLLRSTPIVQPKSVATFWMNIIWLMCRLGRMEEWDFANGTFKDMAASFYSMELETPIYENDAGVKAFMGDLGDKVMRATFEVESYGTSAEFPTGYILEGLVTKDQLEQNQHWTLVTNSLWTYFEEEDEESGASECNFVSQPTTSDFDIAGNIRTKITTNAEVHQEETYKMCTPVKLKNRDWGASESEPEDDDANKHQGPGGDTNNLQVDTRAKRAVDQLLKRMDYALCPIKVDYMDKVADAVLSDDTSVISRMIMDNLLDFISGTVEGAAAIEDRFKSRILRERLPSSGIDDNLAERIKSIDASVKKIEKIVVHITDVQQKPQKKVLLDEDAVETSSRNPVESVTPARLSKGSGYKMPRIPRL